jgi:hypothetical protein
MIRRWTTAILAASLVLGGCASIKKPAATPIKPGMTIATNQMGVILGSGNQCVYTENNAEAALIPAIAAVVIPKLVDYGVSAISSWLESRHKAREASFRSAATSRGAIELYSVKGNPTLLCVMIYRGNRGEAKADSEEWKIESLRKLGLASDPDFFLELRTEYAHNNTAFRLVPQRLEFRRSAAQRSNGRKDILVVGLVEGAFAQKDGSAGANLGSFEISLPGLEEGTTKWGAEQMNGLSSQWIPMPPLTRVKSPTGAEVVSSTIPVSMLVTVEEDQQGSDLMLGVLGAFSDAATKSKDSISKLIADEVIRQLGLVQANDTKPEEPTNKAGQ